MTLVQSWIDSLTLLKPKNAQLFIMVTIKSIIEAYKLLFKYFWWAYVLVVGSCIVQFVIPFVTEWPITRHVDATLFDYIYIGFLFIVPGLVSFILFFATCFATRPSVMNKNCAYFRGQYLKIISYGLLLAASWIVFIVSFVLFMGTAGTFLMQATHNFYNGYWPSLFLSLHWLHALLTSGLFVFSILFFLDSTGGLKSFYCSLWRSLKMVIFNLPLLVLLGLLFYCANVLLLVSVKKLCMYFVFDRDGNTSLTEAQMANVMVIGSRVVQTIRIILMPFFVCLYANIYIKKLHDQFDLYFKPVQ